MLRTLWCFVLSSVAFSQVWAFPGVEEVREDFSTVPAGATPDGWTIVSGSWGVADGALVGGEREGEGRIVLAGEDSIDFSFAVDVTFESVADPSRWVALTFGEDQRASEQDEPRYHTFTVRRDASAKNGLEHAARSADGGWDVRVAEPYTRDLQLGETVRLEVRVVAGRVRGLIDGELALDDALAPDVSAGRVGLHVSGARAIFDNLHVRPLTTAEIVSLRVKRDPLHVPVVIAHRGASQLAPENTMSAFRLAVESGAEACEFDVYPTADGQLVLFHDRSLDRTTDFPQVYGADSGKESRIDALTLEELRRLDAGSWKDPRFRGERIPTLSEALAFMRGRITPIVEIKPDDIGRQVAVAIREAEMADEVFVQSFSPRAIREFRAELPDVPTGLLIGEREPVDPIARALDHVRRAREAGASAVVCDHHSVTPEYVRAIHRRAMAVWVYTVDDTSILRVLRDLGVDGIVTDVPSVALRTLGASAAGELSGGLDTPTDEGAPETPRRRVDILPGQISVLEFARYYSDAVGLPLLADGGDRRWVNEKIVVPSTVRDASPEVVRALLAESGYLLTERKLPGGRRVVFMTWTRTPEGPASPRATPIVEVGSRTSPTAELARTGRVARAEPPESGTIEFEGLTLTAVPEILIAQTTVGRGGGALVRERPEDAAPSSIAGLLQRFDIITYVGSDRIRSPAEFKRRIESLPRDERTSMRVLRGGRTMILPVRK